MQSTSPSNNQFNGVPVKKAVLLAAVAMLGLSNLVQAKSGSEYDINTIKCYGGDPEIKVEAGTVSSKNLGLDRVSMKMTLGFGEGRHLVLRASTPGITLEAAADQASDWVGYPNSEITIHGKSISLECHVD
jgi:hypothetical protein